ncbi:uncharacterized protein [Venturia canescens]|uniref:uncharacterized protein n=1 Tax=Venturia canescens TaxID=32260 RepID=UPI001C9D448C|nr:uncharacterized protein LOC122406388 [Venturia canescens]
MSSYSLDSLEKYSNNDPKTMAREKIGLACTNLKNQDKHKDRTGFVTANNSDEVDETGRKPPTTGRTSKLDENIGKFRRNAIITSGRIAKGEFCWSVEKLPVTVSTKTNFRTGRPVEKKFNVPRGRSSSLSLSKFRHDGSSLSGKGPEDVAEFMKADKKLGNVQPSGITDRSKKPVSYLEFYHRRFATSSEARDCTRVPVGSTPANGEIRTTNKRPTSTNDGDATLLLPRVEDFHRPELQHIVSEESSGSRSCDTFVAKGTEFERNGNDSKPGWPGCCSDGGQPINRQRRVSYKPYGIEDYKNLSVPSPDRSLGPDRHAMEKKGEWLMRRRTYGDSVSALNRQRILRRAEKLKNSRRSDSEKSLSDGLASMNAKHGGPASKALLQRDTSSPGTRLPRSKQRKIFNKKAEGVSGAGISSPNIRKEVSGSNSSKSITKARALTRVDSNLYETSSDVLDDESMNLENLRQRHLQEKIIIDRVLRRGLYA